MRITLLTEQVKTWLKGVYDAITHVNLRAEAANQKYDDLNEKYLKNTVISREVDGRRTQLVSISTTFGTEDSKDVSVKEFTFNDGSVLRYKRTLPKDHSDGLEVVNFETLRNYFNDLNETVATALSRFVKSGGDQVTGSYSFSPKGNNRTFLLDDMMFQTSLGTDVLLNHGEVADVHGDVPNSLVNVKYVKEQTAKFRGSQPVFVSGKFQGTADHRYPDTAQTTYGSQYRPILFWLDGRIWSQAFCLLKYNTKADINGLGLSWVELAGRNPPDTIPGWDLQSAQGRIPYPVSYEVILEYAIDPNWAVTSDPASGSVPFPMPSDRRVRINIGSWLEHVLFIGSDGALWIFAEFPPLIDTPWSAGQSSVGHVPSQFRYYVVVHAWSYLDYNAPFPGSVSLVVPRILSPSGPIPFVGNPFVANTRTYTLRYENFPSLITWHCPPGQGIDIALDTGVGYSVVTITFPIDTDGVSNVSASFTAEYTDQIGTHSLVQALTFTLSSPKLVIQPPSFQPTASVSLSPGHTNPYVINPIPQCELKTRNELGAVSWRLDSATMTNPNADFSLRGGVVFLERIKAAGAISEVTAIVHAEDERALTPWVANLTIQCSTGVPQWLVMNAVWTYSSLQPPMASISQAVGMILRVTNGTVVTQAKIVAATSNSFTLDAAIALPVPTIPPVIGTTALCGVQIIDGNGIADPVSLTYRVTGW